MKKKTKKKPSNHQLVTYEGQRKDSGIDTIPLLMVGLPWCWQDKKETALPAPTVYKPWCYSKDVRQTSETGRHHVVLCA